MTKKNEALRVVASGKGDVSFNAHPGPVLAIEQRVMNEAFVDYVNDVDDVSQIFNFDKYDKIRRSMQIDACGLLANRTITMMLASLGTGLRFKPTQVESAIVHALATTPRKVNSTKFSNKSYAKACTNVIMVVICHSRLLLSRNDIAYSHIEEAEQLKELKKFIAKLEGALGNTSRKLKKRASDCSSVAADVDTSGKKSRLLVKRCSDASSSGRLAVPEKNEEKVKLQAGLAVTEKNEEKVKLQAAAEALAKEPMPSSRGALKAMAIKKRPAGRSQCRTGTAPGLGEIKLILATSQSYILNLDTNDGKWKLVVAVTDVQCAQHKIAAETLFEMALAKRIDKEGLVAMRSTTISHLDAAGASQTAVQRKPAAEDASQEDDVEQDTTQEDDVEQDASRDEDAEQEHDGEDFVDSMGLFDDDAEGINPFETEDGNAVQNFFGF